MSLSRRACYKCGNVGHYAEVCSSSERLCYNCESGSRYAAAKSLTHRQASSPDTSRTSARCLVPLMRSSATTVRDWVMFRPTAQLFG